MSNVQYRSQVRRGSSISPPRGTLFPARQEGEYGHGVSWAADVYAIVPRVSDCENSPNSIEPVATPSRVMDDDYDNISTQLNGDDSVAGDMDLPLASNVSHRSSSAMK